MKNKTVVSSTADLSSLIPDKEPWVRIHPRIPRSTYEVMRVVAARRRMDMTVLLREVLIEQAEEWEKELTRELAEQSGNGRKK